MVEECERLLQHEDVWVSLDTGRLRIFKHQYFGGEEDSIPMNKNTVVESFYLSTSTHHKFSPAIHVHCPEEHKTFKFSNAKFKTRCKNSPSLVQWRSALGQFSRMLLLDLSLLRLGVKYPGIHNDGIDESDGSSIGILGLEAVGHSVWGYTTSFEVIEFTLITVEDEHGLYRTSRVETKRKLKLDQSEIDVRFQNIGRTGLVSMGMSTLCLSIGNAVGRIYIPSESAQRMGVEWCEREHRGGFIHSLFSFSLEWKLDNTQHH